MDLFGTGRAPLRAALRGDVRTLDPARLHRDGRRGSRLARRESPGRDRRALRRDLRRPFSVERSRAGSTTSTGCQNASSTSTTTCSSVDRSPRTRFFRSNGTALSFPSESQVPLGPISADDDDLRRRLQARACLDRAGVRSHPDLQLSPCSAPGAAQRADRARGTLLGAVEGPGGGHRQPRLGLRCAAPGVRLPHAAPRARLAERVVLRDRSAREPRLDDPAADDAQPRRVLPQHEEHGQCPSQASAHWSSPRC